MSYPLEYDYQVLDSGGLTAEQEVRLDIIRALIGEEGAAGFRDDAEPILVATTLVSFAAPLVEWVLNGDPAAPTPPPPADGATPTA